MAGYGPELLLGARFDPTFGPLLMLGTGGTWVEILQDVKVYLTPINRDQALQAVSEMTLAQVLAGARGDQGYDTGAIADLIVAFSRMIRDLDGHVTEIEINPVRITRDRGPVAVDALIVRSEDHVTTDNEGEKKWASS